MSLNFKFIYLFVCLRTKTQSQFQIESGLPGSSIFNLKHVSVGQIPDTFAASKAPDMLCYLMESVTEVKSIIYMYQEYFHRGHFWNIPNMD